MCSLFRKITLAMLMMVPAGLPAADGGMLRVCADPNNLPFSNRSEMGLENHLAALLAQDLGMKVEYVWVSQRRNFIGKSLNGGVCDAIMGVPAAIDSAATTQPYYRSTYVWITRRGSGFSSLPLSSLYDERLAKLRIGVHIVDNGYAPPGQILSGIGLGTNLKGFNLYGSAGEQNPPARLIAAVSAGEVDVALAWGPLAGYFAGPDLEITPVTPSRAGLVPFVYEMAVAVRKGDEALRTKLDQAIGRQCPAIGALLTKFKIPQVNEGGPLCASVSSAHASLH